MKCDIIKYKGQEFRAQAGAAAVQQAMREVFGLTYRDIGLWTGVHPRTVWQHVNRAEMGAHLKAWESRTEEERKLAAAVAYLRLTIPEAPYRFSDPAIARAKSHLNHYSVLTKDSEDDVVRVYTLL